MQSQLSSRQLDELISAQLMKNISPTPYKILGSSNGLYLHNLFNYKTMVYIDAIVNKDKLLYQLVIVALENLQGDQKLGNVIIDGKSKKLKNVIRIPLAFSGCLGLQRIQKPSQITKIQIQMKQAPQQQNIIAVKMSLIYKQQSPLKSKDTLSILVLNQQHISKLAVQIEQSNLNKNKSSSTLNSNQQQKVLNLLRVKCNDNIISDFIWHPKSAVTLLTLLQSQCIQIWNLRNQDFGKPQHIIKLKNIKGSSIILGSIKFTSFAMIDDRKLEQKWNNKKINTNKYSLFLMNSIGQIYSLFPFLPTGIQLAIIQYDLIFEIALGKETQEHHLLTTYLNNSNLQQLPIVNTYLLTASPFPQPYLHLQKWYSNNQMSYTKVSDQNKLQKHQYFYDLKMYHLNDNWVLLAQVFYRRVVGSNWIILSLIGKQLQIGQDCDNVIYRIVQIRNQQQSFCGDLKILNTYSKIIQNDFSKFKTIYYTQNNGLYRLDFSPICKFIQTSQIKHLQGSNSFQVTLIFQLPPNQNILAMCTQQTFSCITFVRRTANKIKFQIQYLENIDNFSQVENITKVSNSLLAKLQGLKIQIKNKQLSKDQAKKNQLQLGSDKLKQYQEKGIQEFKKDYAKYCQGIKYRIDQGMSKLKTNYELMNKKIKRFNEIKLKKKQLTCLLQQVDKNNEQINKLLFAEKQQNYQPRTQYSQIQNNINALNKLLQTAKSKKIVLNTQGEQYISKQIDKLFEKLKPVRVSLEQAKKIKKEYDNHKRV